MHINIWQGFQQAYLNGLLQMKLTATELNLELTGPTWQIIALHRTPADELIIPLRLLPLIPVIIQVPTHTHTYTPNLYVFHLKHFSQPVFVFHVDVTADANNANTI